MMWPRRRRARRARTYPGSAEVVTEQPGPNYTPPVMALDAYEPDRPPADQQPLAWWNRVGLTTQTHHYPEQWGWDHHGLHRVCLLHPEAHTWWHIVDGKPERCLRHHGLFPTTGGDTGA